MPKSTLAPVSNTFPDAEQQARWQAVLQRAGAGFFYAVRSTGIYCRPSCGARTPKPENVQFFETTTAAEAAGFRPCKRCQPKGVTHHEQHAIWVLDVCRTIENSTTFPSLAELAAERQISHFYLQRIFKSITGLTPKAYASAHQAERVRRTLADNTNITQAIYEAGYNANSRFYEKSNQILGMTPKSYRAGGARSRIHFAIGECSLGAILVASSERGICAILIDDDAEKLLDDLQQRFPKAQLIGADTAFEQQVAQVIGLIEAPQLGHKLPLDIRGTAFQQRVWQALQKIPPCQTLSYSEVAERIGAPKASRAVASACAANSLAVAIPCHRVIRIDGGMGGYRWGIERKRSLLTREIEAVRESAPKPVL